MTLDEAFEEMKRRGWGYVWMGDTIAIGPITNPNYVEDGEPPLINVIAFDRDQVKALEKAIALSKGGADGRHDS